MESEPTAQDWVQVSLAVDNEAAEAVSALFDQYGEGGVVIEEVPLTLTVAEPGAGGEPGRPMRRLAKAFLPADDQARLDALLQALWHLGRLHPIEEPEVRELGAADWAEAWKAGYQVVSIGRRTRIVPSWIPYTPAEGEIIVTLDPGMAFGTGLHPTTQLCLMAMEELVTPGMRLLDVGAGSGILAIAAARLGAAEVLAVDIEGVAVRTARENVALNGVADIVCVEQGSVDGVSRGAYDGVLANILAEIIARLAPDLARHVAAGGWLVASGILDVRLPAVERALGLAGMDVVRHWHMEDWVALEAR